MSSTGKAQHLLTTATLQSDQLLNARQLTVAGIMRKIDDTSWKTGRLGGVKREGTTRPKHIDMIRQRIQTEHLKKIGAYLDKKITLNLQAPILYSPEKCRGLQVILEKTKYESRTPLPEVKPAPERAEAIPAAK